MPDESPLIKVSIRRCAECSSQGGCFRENQVKVSLDDRPPTLNTTQRCPSFSLIKGRPLISSCAVALKHVTEKPISYR